VLGSSLRYEQPQEQAQRVAPYLIINAGWINIFAMKLPITRYGLPQVVVLPAIIVAVMLIAGSSLFVVHSLRTNNYLLTTILAIEVVLAIVLIFILSFFRDPARIPPADKNILLSPADGTIADIEVVDEKEFIKGKALRIGIFLSIFNVHINRSPCDVKIEKIIYKKGDFKDARDPSAGSFNESNDLFLIRKQAPFDKLMVRQISGAIARRIVCKAEVGAELAGGQKFGMIKFGSRTELYVPANEAVKCSVKIGDKVKAGLTTLVKYKR